MRSQVMGSAHHLIEMNISPTFNENPVRAKGDMEGAQNSRINPMTFYCKLNLMNVYLSHGFGIPSH